MESPLLKDPDVFPNKEILQKTLGKSYSAYERLINDVTGPGYCLEPVWNFYKDGKAWLCKVVFKKKTVFWLSVWNQYFKVAFYFTEKNKQGIDTLDIDNKIKQDFINHKPVGKLLPLVLNINSDNQVKDALTVAGYKMRLK